MVSSFFKGFAGIISGEPNNSKENSYVDINRFKNIKTFEECEKVLDSVEDPSLKSMLKTVAKQFIIVDNNGKEIKSEDKTVFDSVAFTDFLKTLAGEESFLNTNEIKMGIHNYLDNNSDIPKINTDTSN